MHLRKNIEWYFGIFVQGSHSFICIIIIVIITIQKKFYVFCIDFSADQMMKEAKFYRKYGSSKKWPKVKIIRSLFFFLNLRFFSAV